MQRLPMPGIPASSTLNSHLNAGSTTGNSSGEAPIRTEPNISLYRRCALDPDNRLAGRGPATTSDVGLRVAVRFGAGFLLRPRDFGMGSR